MGSDRDGLDWLRFLQLEVQVLAKKTSAAWKHPVVDMGKYIKEHVLMNVLMCILDVSRTHDVGGNIIQDTA